MRAEPHNVKGIAWVSFGSGVDSRGESLFGDDFRAAADSATGETALLDAW